MEKDKKELEVGGVDFKTSTLKDKQNGEQQKEETQSNVYQTHL